MKKIFLILILHLVLINSVFSQVVLSITQPEAIIPMYVEENFSTTHLTRMYYSTTEKDGVATMGYIRIAISGIVGMDGSNVDIVVKRVGYGGAEVVRKTKLVTGGIAYANLYFHSDLVGLSGIFEIELQDSSTHAVLTNFVIPNNPHQPYLVLQKEKVVSIAGAPYDFRLIWCDDFFPTPADAVSFVSNTETALNAVWQKEVELNNVKLREVRKKNSDLHQTSIVTTNKKLSTIFIAIKMFARWTQENYFKYLRSDYALDHIIQYLVNEINPDFKVVNPLHRKLTNKLKKLVVGNHNYINWCIKI